MIATCPHSDAALVRSARPGAGSALVPAGATGVVLCRYGGASEIGPPAQPHVLARSRTVASLGTVAGLARALNALRPPSPEPVSCGEDEGTAVVAIFTYPSGPADPVTVGLTGCETVSNGHGARTGLGSAVTGRIDSLVPVTPPIPLGPGPVITRDAELAVHVGDCETRGCPAHERIAVLDGASAVAISAATPGRTVRFQLYPGAYTVRLVAGGAGDRGIRLASATVTADAAQSRAVTLIP